MQVVNLRRYRNKGLVAALKELITLAESGQVQGLAFVVKFGPHDHRAGSSGDYKSHPEEALMATLKMKQSLVNQDSSF
jgi:hypothetical protein